MKQKSTYQGELQGKFVAAWRTSQDAQLSQRDRAAACVIVYAKSRSLELGDSILRTL